MPSDPVAKLRRLATQRDKLRDVHQQIRAALVEARENGASAAKCAAALGVSRQHVKDIWSAENQSLTHR